eukprot:m.128551 g.128551  ORF g.128551 m.128551 type:complete len:822 (+) comp15833_c0_seq4:1839-4304(+)
MACWLLFAVLGLASATANPWIAVLPNSTLFPSNQTSVAILVTVPSTIVEATECRYGLGLPSPSYEDMHGFSIKNGTSFESSIPLVNNTFAPVAISVRCSFNESYVIVRYYRRLSSLKKTFPRTGNLWGSSNFEKKGLEYAALHIDLWLGANWNTIELQRLRQLNPNTIALTSINAVEGGDGLPEHYYLHNISGQTKKDRCEVWPGSYRLDLTKSEVSRYHAQAMYELVLHGGTEGHPDSGSTTLPFDGIFVDNVFLTQSWLHSDIHGNPFYPDPDGTGKPMPAKQLDAEWRAGVLLELNLFRTLMPHALMSGHVSDPTDPGIAQVFNARSIGFTIPDIIEKHQSFHEGWQQYQQWFTYPKKPYFTMVESAPFLQIGYGYGYDSQIHQGSIPPSTLLFAQHYFSYMRFGLAFTLMRDGYFCHELGDSSHGQDWWYDELDHNLGQATSEARLVLKPPSGAAQQFPTIPTNWQLWVAASGQANVTYHNNAYAAITVTRVPDDISEVDLFSNTLNLTKGQAYTITLTAQAPQQASRTITLNSRQNQGNWTGYGLDNSLTITDQWQQYNTTFTATATDPAARFSVFVGNALGEVWVTNISVHLASPPVYERDFECGKVLLNGDDKPYTIALPPGYRRLNGSQAPRWQYIVDDASSAFHPSADDWSVVSIEGGYSLQHPSSEEDAGPYYHQWATSCVISNRSGATAIFDLGLHNPDTYSLKTWWANDPVAKQTWATTVRWDVLDSNGRVVSGATLDQTSAGDVWQPIATNVSLAPGAYVRLTCKAETGRICVADAVLVESAQRYNDGTSAETVVLAGMDGIVLGTDC